MAKYIEREADGFKYYVVRNKSTGQYFRGKGVNKWGKYYNQASIYRFKKHAENAVVDLAHRGAQAEVVEIRIAETSADVVEVRHGRWQWDVETHGDPMYGVDEDFGYRCSECQVWADEYGVDGDIYEEPPTHILHYCPNCGAKMDGEGEGDG